MAHKVRFDVLALLMALLAAGPASAQQGPDAGGYTATAATAYSFIDITASGVRALAGADDDTSTAPIGFVFTLYGQTYATACLSANGLITFGGCADSFANQDLTATPTPGNLAVVAPFWTDLTFLQPNADAVYYQTLGVAPARQFVVQWNSVYPQNAAQPVTFQAVLYEGSNQIRFQYHTLDAGAGDPSTNGGASTVGVCAATGRLDGRCLQWSYNVPVLGDGHAILFSPSAPTTGGRPGEMSASALLTTDRHYKLDFIALEQAPPDAPATKLVRIELRVENILSKSEKAGLTDAELLAKMNVQGFSARLSEAPVFTEDPALPGPGGTPRPQIDTVVMSGVGEWNRQPGCRFEIVATDEAGPPHRETMRIRIWDLSNALVVDVGGVPISGWIRSARIPH